MSDVERPAPEEPSSGQKRKSPEATAAALLEKMADKSEQAKKAKAKAKTATQAAADGQKVHRTNRSPEVSPPPMQKIPKMPTQEGGVASYRGAVITGKDSAKKFRLFISAKVAGAKGSLDVDRKWATSSKAKAFASCVEKVDDFWKQ